MTTSNSSLPYSLYQDKRTNSKFRNKWYARARHLRTYSFEQFIQHIADHGSNFTRAEVAGVMYKMQDCLLELIQAGNKVDFGDLGTFYLSISSKPAETLELFNVAENIIGVNLKFAASRKASNNLTSPSLRAKTRFVNIQSLVTDTERTQYNAAIAEPEPPIAEPEP